MHSDERDQRYAELRETRIVLQHLLNEQMRLTDKLTELVIILIRELYRDR